MIGMMATAMGLGMGVAMVAIVMMKRCAYVETHRRAYT